MNQHQGIIGERALGDEVLGGPCKIQAEGTIIDEGAFRDDVVVVV